MHRANLPSSCYFKIEISQVGGAVACNCHSYSIYKLPVYKFIAQVLVGPSKQLKQIIQTEHNIQVKNPNWPEANQLAIYKHGQGFELGATEKQI